MKKSVLVIALAFGVSGAFAQDLTSKRGEPFLPEAEDWAISFNADPVFRYVGNAFSGATTTNQAPNTTWINTTQTIVGKKFIDEKNAFRVMLRLGMVNQTFKNMVTDNSQTSTPAPFPEPAYEVEDKFKMSRTNIAIGVGKEWRRGKTRLQGYYGADVMLWISMASEKYTYGNIMTPAPATVDETSTPTSTDWDPATGAIMGESPNGNRTLSNKAGMTFGIGVRGFLGAEYFIFPKIAIGAEYGWGLGFQSSGKGKQVKESTNATTLGETETITSGSSKFGFDTDINSGGAYGFPAALGGASLKVTFHFLELNKL